jgi:hypothetical protein
MGNFELDMRHTNPPPNDNFANAQTIFGSNIHVTGDNIDATSEPGEPSGFVDGPLYSVWYSWTAPASGTATMDVCGSDFDTVLTVFTGGSLSSLTRLASNDQAPNCGVGGSKLILNVNGGTTYKIAVDGYFEQGDIDLRLALAGSSPVHDSEPPQSKINKLIVDSDHHRATIKFGSSEPGSSFECKVDHKPWRFCRSPKTIKHLEPGRHTVKVRARDAAGNLDASAAVRSFRIAD